MAEKLQDWYPSKNQLQTPEALEMAFRQVLNRHYAARNEITTVKESVGKQSKPAPAKPEQQGWNTMMLGLRIEPIDPNTLVDGATLKYVAATKTFKFS